MDPNTQEALITHLGQFVTLNKKEKIAEVLTHRTRHVAIVLENIYQSQNASATLRTAECMGLQDAYVIENSNEYEVNPDVALGASKWVDIHRFNQQEENTAACFEHLRAQGYRIVGTSLGADSVHPADLPLDQKLALVYGNEEYGMSPYAHANTDLNIKIPMYGFTQSFNISVSVAISLSHVIRALHQSPVDWQLSDQEKADITLQWYRKIIDRSDIIERTFLNQWS